MLGNARVFGPAYLDRILRVDSSLLGEGAPPIDQSMGGRPRFIDCPGLTLIDREGSALDLQLPDDWPGPRGAVELERLLALEPAATNFLRGESWADELGGMGAGIAAATGAELVTALGPPDDPASAAIEGLLGEKGVAARIVRRDRPADWTLVVSSGAYCDTLAIGFRDCLQSLTADDLAPFLAEPTDVRIVAALPNRLAAEALKAPGARLRVFAPAMRNAIDRDRPILDLIEPVDVLCCNHLEWEATADREEVAARLSILVVTEGPAGSTARFADPSGSARSIRVPAFPRSRPPRDTVRAGEAFVSFFLGTLIARGWRSESCVAEPELIREAMTRASAAAALTLDLGGFGFPTPERVDAAVARGVVD
mgnify:CR=1 FL=1